MVAVHVTTDQFPALRDEIERREAAGLDTYDEWWNGEYRIVTGPTPEHGELLNELIVFFHPLVKANELRYAAPVNIGINREDCRVPDLGVYHPDTPRTSAAFLETAALVVEVLSPGERAGQKLPFYQAWGVGEYLEISLENRTAALYRNDGDTWARTGASSILGFDVVDGERLVAEDGELDLRALS
jgi:Uma2 family endonuclease